MSASDAADEVVECKQALLRGEISAVQTYDQVIEKMGDTAKAPDLRKMREEHVRARDTISRHVEMSGEPPEEGSGAWGAWARLTAGTAKIFGETAAMKALKEGEEHGLKSYERAIENVPLDAAFRTEVESRLMPAQRTHIARLDQLMDQQ